MKEFYFPVRENTNLHCCQWLPQGKPRGVVQLVHGIAEYVARYEQLARVFTDKGFVVVGEDHMGHGGSISESIPQGCFAEGWSAAVSDTYRLLQITQEEFSDLSYFLYGHSMGSFMARTLLYTYPKAGLAGVILSGTGWMPKPVLKAGRTFCLLEGKRKGLNQTSPTVVKLLFGSYNKGVSQPRTPSDWLSRDEAEVDKYVADPLLGFSPSIGLAREMLGGMLMNESKANLARMPKDLPVLFVSGDQDPVGSNGKGVEQTAEAFRAAGMRDVRCRLYPGGRHEMHNELNREDLFADVTAFVEEIAGRWTVR